MARTIGLDEGFASRISLNAPAFVLKNIADCFPYHSIVIDDENDRLHRNISPP